MTCCGTVLSRWRQCHCHTCLYALLLCCHYCCCCSPQVCGKGPATTPEKLEAALFDGLANSQPQTVQGAFRSCSYGNADFSKAGVQVLSVTVPIPCKGSTPWNLHFDSSTCPYVGEYASNGCSQWVFAVMGWLTHTAAAASGRPTAQQQLAEAAPGSWC